MAMLVNPSESGSGNVAETVAAGIACGSCGTILPAEWASEPRDQRSPCPKCRGTQRRTAFAKSATSAEPQRPPGLLGWIGKLIRRGRG